jgi:tetratricopeptide (TPR) repeat protein
MIAGSEFALDYPLTTAGDIAINNLESARRQSWSRFWQDPQRPGIAECIVEQEQFTAQYVGDLGALDRLTTLVNQLYRLDGEPVRTALIHAQVCSMGHRFAEARTCLAQAKANGAPEEGVNGLTLSIDQACGTRLESVLDARKEMAAKSGRLEDLVPLGALYADLRDFDAADKSYRQALRSYQDVSPFAVGWVCFQLGVLWGELVTEPQLERAAEWYEKAIAYLPCYVKARVHLAEIYSHRGRFGDAETLLTPVLASGDPEVNWRLADVMTVTGRLAEAEVQLQAARNGFEVLLEKHLLAFADHGADFYSGIGEDAARAFELASINLANRPTLRAFEQAYETAVGARKTQPAFKIADDGGKRWGSTAAFALSPLRTIINGAKSESGSKT